MRLAEHLLQIIAEFDQYMELVKNIVIPRVSQIRKCHGNMIRFSLHGLCNYSCIGMMYV